MEVKDLTRVRLRGAEDPCDREEGHRDHREEGQRRCEEGPEADPQVCRDEEQQDADDRDSDRPPGDRRVDRREAGRREMEPVDDVEGRQDHVQRRYGEPAEPVRPGREAIHVLGKARPALLVGRVGVGRRAARPLGHHRRELGEEQAEKPAGARDEEGNRDGGGAQRRHHDRRNAGHQDRPSEADYEGAPPIRFLFESPACVIQLVNVGSHSSPPDRRFTLKLRANLLATASRRSWSCRRAGLSPS